MLGIKIVKLNLLPGMQAREIVGIDFSGNNLKIAHVRLSANKKEVVNLFSRSILGVKDEDIPKIINEAFHGLNAKNPYVINILSSHLAITKNIEIPSVDHKEIKEIINLQAGRHTPYSREEIIIDYIDLGTYKNSYTKVLLVIVSRNVAKRNFEILERSGIRLDKVLFAPEGLTMFISRALGLETKDSPVNIIHVNEDFTDFNIVFKGKVIFIRSIPIGAQNLVAEKEKYLTRFTDEVKRSLEAYQIENIEKTPNSLILTGAVSELKDLENNLNNNLPFSVKVLPSYKNILLSDKASKETSLSRRLSYLDVIAPILNWKDCKIDLIPEEVKLKMAFEKRSRDLIKTGILVLALFVLIFSILISHVFLKSAYLKKLNDKYQPLNKEAKKLEGDFEKVSLIKNYISKRGYPLEVLIELYNVSPDQVALNNIRFDDQGKFTIRGTADSMSTVFSLVDNMEKAKYFKDVKTKYTAKRKEGMMDVADFEIACILEKKVD
ncbi:MAG: pilus assembly protein PilM [Candidatus Omnitrophica bacterium]|nr:pilus assembly protein PilM [Candidatus Omnitrophota bacterium]